MAAAHISRLPALAPSPLALEHFVANLKRGEGSKPLLLRGLLSSAGASSSAASSSPPSEAIPGLQPTPALHWNADGALGGILKARHRVVRVEMARPGRGYVRSEGEGGEWMMGEMSVELFHAAFLARTIPSSGGPPMTGYVAQQPLSELPELEADVPPLPHLAWATQDWGRMLWVGGAGTFTPTHRDPHHNLFAQLVGRKRVHLFPPSCAEHLHLHPGGALQNTSRIPTEEPFLRPLEGQQEEEWDVQQALDHPEASHVLLGPADVLFIPKRWLHCVAGLDDSASVNAWFH